MPFASVGWRPRRKVWSGRYSVRGALAACHGRRTRRRESRVPTESVALPDLHVTTGRRRAVIVGEADAQLERDAFAILDDVASDRLVVTVVGAFVLLGPPPALGAGPQPRRQLVVDRSDAARLGVLLACHDCSSPTRRSMLSVVLASHWRDKARRHRSMDDVRGRSSESDPFRSRSA